MAENLTDTNVGNIDYIRREDAKDALQEKVFHNLSDEFYGAMQVIDDLPSADVVQVVRCKDCKYHSYDGMSNQYFCYHAIMCGEVTPDFYCAYGERKE